MKCDFKLAARLINASICAYQIYENGAEPPAELRLCRRVAASDGGDFYLVVPQYQEKVEFAEPPDRFAPAFAAFGFDTIDAALCGLTVDGYALVAIRGTLPPQLTEDNTVEWIADWVNDARCRRMPWRPGGGEYGVVESGFGIATKKIWPWLRSALRPLIGQAPKGILVTGHSKGGAMSYLIASLIREEWPELAGRIQVHAFAPAVACGGDFVATYNARGLGAATFRYQVEFDLVPFLPRWNQADIWRAVRSEGFWEKAAWTAAGDIARLLTGDGYAAPGTFFYFTSDHEPVPDARVADTALPAVAARLEAGDFSAIGAAHNAVKSYLPCLSGR